MSDAPPSQPATQTAEPAAPVVAKPVVRPRPAGAEPTSKPLPPFRVLLHNDDVNDMEYVVQTLVGLAPMTAERAVEVMFEAHFRGVGLVLVTHRERAELYRDQFQSKQLVVSIEPAE